MNLIENKPKEPLKYEEFLRKSKEGNGAILINISGPLFNNNIITEAHLSNLHIFLCENIQNLQNFPDESLKRFKDIGMIFVLSKAGEVESLRKMPPANNLIH